VIREKLFAALVPLVPDERVFPGGAPLDTPRPYITYRQVGGEAVDFIDKATPSKRNARVQVNVWSDDGDEATALIYAVEDALRAVPGLQTTPLGAHFDRDEPDLNLYGRQQDFSVWADR
jgi:hypothetical protein